MLALSSELGVPRSSRTCWHCGVELPGVFGRPIYKLLKNGRRVHPSCFEEATNELRDITAQPSDLDPRRTFRGT